MVVKEFLRDLKVGLVSLGNMFDPDILLLGGAVSQGLRPYLAEIQSWVKERSFPAVGEHMVIDFTYFSNNSGAIGAAPCGAIPGIAGACDIALASGVAPPA